MSHPQHTVMMTLQFTETIAQRKKSRGFLLPIKKISRNARKWWIIAVGLEKE